MKPQGLFTEGRAVSAYCQHADSRDNALPVPTTPQFPVPVPPQLALCYSHPPAPAQSRGAQ